MEEELPLPDLLSALLPVLLIVGGIVVVVVLFVCVMVFLAKKNGVTANTSSSPASYFPRGSLLNPVESRFYEALMEAAQGAYWIFPKVGLADIVRPEPINTSPQNVPDSSRIAGRSIDFALCIPGNYHIVGLIELDDGTLGRSEQQQREQRVDEVTASAGIPVLHIQAETEYDIEDLREALREMASEPGEEV